MGDAKETLARWRRSHVPVSDRPPGRLRYKARGHVTRHAATREAQVTRAKCGIERTFV